MAELMTIQGTQLQVKEYKDKRVVTFKDIDMVHQRPEGTAKRNFNTIGNILSVVLIFTVLTEKRSVRISSRPMDLTIVHLQVFSSRNPGT